MKPIYLFLFTIAVFNSSIAQPGKVINDANSSIRKVDAFHAIFVEDGIDLYLTQGKEQAVAVSANKIEYRDKIVTKVINGVLRIAYGSENGFYITWRDRKLKAYISVKDIDALTASGGSDVIIEGIVSANNLKINLSGGSDFVGELNANELFISLSGGSDGRVKGTATNLKVTASGGSDFLGYDLQAEFAVVEASGGSDAHLKVSKEIFAEASGGSDIDYKGNPIIKRNSSSGGGSVTKRN